MQNINWILNKLSKIKWNKINDLNKIMKKFEKFYFERISFDEKNLIATFFYSFDENIEFKEIIDFKSDFFSTIEKKNEKIIDNLLFHLHLALWISYYKLYPTDLLIVKSWFLDDYQIAFWKKFYLNWLWEFLYVNKINPNKLFNFVSFYNSQSRILPLFSKFSIKWNKCLVPVWWWKDSIVSMELLKDAGFDFDLFVFWKIDALKQACADVSWKKILLVKRNLSDNLFELNKQWYYNWHVPITWIIVFVMQVVAYIYGYKYLILSNEKSANFWNVNWNWLEINHQYSKSLDFEIDFDNYVKENIGHGIEYFSLLRWLYELKIAEIFAKKWKKYFEVFSSCNWNFKININLSNGGIINNGKKWCNSCSKCVFVFTILYPYLERDEIIKIFWKDLYEEKKLEKIFRELLLIDWIKPFECVGTNEEVIISMKKSIYKIWNWKIPYILKKFKKEVINKFKENDFIKIEDKLLKIYDEDLIPKYIKNKVF